MKLISMHVDNFGGLHNYDCSFDEGLNVVLHDNGWGKTTMAAFLKAMLYGYDTKRSRDITENERKRYLPWQGGRYGGQLDFEADGRRYRIYRTFGETPRFDTAKIVQLDTNTTAQIPSDRIGETLFHLDASAFQRSVFINQNGLAIDGAASSIHSRLNALVSQANDVAAFDGAIAQLTQQVKVYEKTGARGLLGDIARQIAEKEGLRAQLDREISAQDAARERLVQINLLLNHLNQELAENNRKLEAVSGEEKKLEAANHLIREIDERIEAFCQKLNALETELGGMIPGHEQLEQIKQQEQLRATLQQRLNVLQLEKENVTSSLSTLISRYGGTLPTAEQLDEAQRLYGEMQGLLSASKSDAESDPVPEAYTLITNAANVMEDFAGKLQSAIQTSARIHELILQLDAQKKDLQHEINAWSSKTRRFSELDADVKKLQCKLKEQQNDAPVVIQPTIAALEEIAKKQRELGQREAEAKAQIAHEEKEWSKRKAEYAELKKQLATLEEHLEAQRCYGDTPVQETLSRLSEHQHAQQKLKALHASLDSLCLSEAEEALLKSSPDTLPDPDEGNEMLKKQRQVQRHQDELQGLSSRLEGEKAKKDSLVASLEQWNAATRTAPAPVSEPKKPAGKALVCSGVAFLIAGGFLSLMILPILAGISVFGALLIAAGLINSRSYQKKAQAYANHQKAAAEYEAAKEQQQRISRQLTEVQNSIEHVKAQMEDVEHKISSEKAALSAWLAQWGNANAENMEAEILRIVEWSAHIAQLRSRQADNLAVQRSMQELQENLKAERVVIEKAYPVTAGMTAAEASETLQAAYTRYRILAEQVQNARQLLNRFIADGTIPENEYTKADAPRASILLQQLQDVKAENDQLCALRLKIDRQYPDISGRSVDDAIAFLRDRMSLYQVAESQVNSSVQNLERFFNETGYCRNELSLNESPHLAVVMAACASTEQELNQLLQNANMVLKELELDTDAAHICQALSKADELLNIYIQHNAKCADLEVRKEKNRRQADEVQQALVRQLTFPGVRLIDSNVMDTIAAVRKDITSAVQLQEKQVVVLDAIAKTEAEYKTADAIIAQFISAHVHFALQSREALPAICEKADAYNEFAAAKQQLELQRASMDKERESLRTADEAGKELRSAVDSLKNRRDALLIEYTQKGEMIRQADRALEMYPDIVCEIRSLYEQKQKAQGTLALLKRTIQLITEAKANLATRYLSKVEQLFNRYMHLWLNSNAIRGVLDINFHVSIEENSKLHVAQGYSTGYCDMIDFCMRLALVDTLFEKEQPFLILDDPFVNLDEKRLEKALELLNVMAANKQIIYFVCHPIRAIEAGKNKDMSVQEKLSQLAETTRKARDDRSAMQISRSTPVQKAPKEIYRIVESAASQAIKPANPHYTITNSIFSLSFIAGESARQQNYCFELFFIDACGRVLNDRQIIEISGGQLSVDRIQFNLNTRDDSGDEFELMIRESGHNDYEIAAKYSFRAKLAFTGTFNFDM